MSRNPPEVKAPVRWRPMMLEARIRSAAVWLLLVTALATVGSPAQAQQLIMLGQYGLLGGTTPPPGVYVGGFGYNLNTDELKTPDGSALHGPEFNQWVFGLVAEVVTPWKVIGADYGAAVAVPWANIRMDFPRLGFDHSTGVGLSQLWVVPVMLGWHLPRADLTVHYAFYPPTGNYSPGASNNTALGMWTNEFSARGTYYFDQDRRWHASLSAFYDINGKKQDTDYTQGNPLTLMGGAGGNYGDGWYFGWAGIVGYAQWQLTSTTGSDVPLPVANNKTQIYAVGPEITTLEGALTLRYEWQFGGRFSTQGGTFYGQFVMPVKLFK